MYLLKYYFFRVLFEKEGSVNIYVWETLNMPCIEFMAYFNMFKAYIFNSREVNSLSLGNTTLPNVFAHEILLTT